MATRREDKDLNLKAKVQYCAAVMSSYNLIAPTHRSIREYYEHVAALRDQGETFEYRLGNRSALEWVIDQYQVTEDKHSGIRSDPNRPDDPEYIVRLVGQVIRVSLETVKLVKSLPAL